MKRILIIVQNLPVPFDRRVWLECQALVAAGYDVSVVCPKGPGDPAYQVIDTVRDLQVPAVRARRQQAQLRHRVRVLVPRNGVAGAARLAARAGSRSAGLQPARHLLADRASALRVIGRHPVRLRPPRPVPRALRVPLSRRPAARLPGTPWRSSAAPTGPRDHVISTNESYRDIAIAASGKAPEDVTVVRTGPTPSSCERGEAGAVAAQRAAVPRRLHRRHGPAGRRRHRHPRR